jgi:hypothetical protein
LVPFNENLGGKEAKQLFVSGCLFQNTVMCKIEKSELVVNGDGENGSELTMSSEADSDFMRITGDSVERRRDEESIALTIDSDADSDFVDEISTHDSETRSAQRAKLSRIRPKAGSVQY